MRTLLMPGVADLLGGGGGGGTNISPTDTSTSGPAISGGGGVTFGPVTLGNKTNWLLWIGIVAAILIFWKPIKKALHL